MVKNNDERMMAALISKTKTESTNINETKRNKIRKGEHKERKIIWEKKMYALVLFTFLCGRTKKFVSRKLNETDMTKIWHIYSY